MHGAAADIKFQLVLIYSLLPHLKIPMTLFLLVGGVVLENQLLKHSFKAASALPVRSLILFSASRLSSPSNSSHGMGDPKTQVIFPKNLGILRSLGQASNVPCKYTGCIEQ